MRNLLPLPSAPQALPLEVEEAPNFDAFYRQYERLVRGIVFPLVGPSDTDDVVQTVFLRCWQKQHTLRDPLAAKGWVAMVAINQARDHWRRRKPLEPLSDLPGPAADDAPLSHSAALMQALQCLDLEHREVVVLRFFQDKSLAEVAEILRIPAGTVKSRLHYAKARLKAALTAMGVRHEFE